jgi:NAD(P)H-hydrate epimerase
LNIFPMNCHYPIFSLDEARAFEASILQADPARTAEAMENAGRAIGSALLKDYTELRPWPKDPRVHVLAGKGLNTGDALIACEEIHRAIPGIQVTLVLTAPADEFNPVVSVVLERLRKLLGDRLHEMDPAAYLAAGPQPVDVVVDGLYGHGFRPPLRPEVAGLLKEVNSHKDIGVRASVDLPSGMADATDPATFVADFTYIPGVAKAPCFEEANKAFTGRLRFLEIEPFLNPTDAGGKDRFVASPSAFKALNRIRPAASDKRDYGHCLIIAGSPGMAGAAQMATLGALQAGAGLVTTFAPSGVARYLRSVVPEAMWRSVPLTPEGSLDSDLVHMVGQLAPKANALLIGPGLVLDRGTTFLLSRIVRETSLPVVLDASALVPGIISAALSRPDGAGPVILTPHAGELARIQGVETAGTTHGELLQFSKRFPVVTLVKGSPNVVCDSGRLVYVPAGGPVLARGGSGDILSGMLAALLARDPSDAAAAAVAAAAWHGAAADCLAREHGAVAVRTTELLPRLASALRA